jgi:hypothetical protein
VVEFDLPRPASRAWPDHRAHQIADEPEQFEAVMRQCRPTPSSRGIRLATHRFGPGEVVPMLMS